MKKYLLIICTFIAVIGGIAILKENQAKGPVYGEGGIEVTYDKTPLFNTSSIAPGFSTTGRVTIKSTSGVSQKVGLKLHAGKLADILTSGKLTLKVKDVDSNVIIFGGDGGKKLLSLFMSPIESQLFSLNTGQTKVIDVIISMDPTSSNTYQGKSMNFDLSLGFIASSRFRRI